MKINSKFHLSDLSKLSKDNLVQKKWKLNQLIFLFISLYVIIIILRFLDPVFHYVAHYGKRCNFHLQNFPVRFSDFFEAQFYYYGFIPFLVVFYFLYKNQKINTQLKRQSKSAILKVVKIEFDADKELKYNKKNILFNNGFKMEVCNYDKDYNSIKAGDTYKITLAYNDELINYEKLNC